MTLMMCLVGMTSYSQEKDPSQEPGVYVGELLIKFRTIWENEKEIKHINFKLKESSYYLIKSSNQAIGAVVVAIVAGGLSTLLMTSESTPMYNTKQLGYATIVAGGAATLGFGISSIINKRKGYKALSGLKL